MRKRTRSRSLPTHHLVKHTLPGLALAVALGAVAALANQEPPIQPPLDLTAHDALEVSLGYRTAEAETVVLAPSVVQGRALPEDVRDYPDASQCVHYVAHAIYDTYGNTAFFFRGRKDPRNARDFPRHHTALGGKSGSTPTVMRRSGTTSTPVRRAQPRK